MPDDMGVFPKVQWIKDAEKANTILFYVKQEPKPNLMCLCMCVLTHMILEICTF